ncbi:hypothetical protein [Aureimonas sp. AU40]|uniref:hypothetical protein n=1 Tax=Aureimonas sp. AU40 TaxID=1637747 RepID=UPI000780A834|nr:hypothetical protein [Aureimonas sp. AU40]
MTTPAEYDYALLNRLAEQGFDGARTMPNSARAPDRFNDMNRKGWIPRNPGASILTVAGRKALAAMEADRTLDIGRIDRALDIEKRIEAHVAVIDPWLGVEFYPAERGTADVAPVREGRDIYGAQVSYQIETVEEAQEHFDALDLVEHFFMPLAVEQSRHDGMDVFRFVGLLARPKKHNGRQVARFPRLAEERFHVLRHPTYDALLRAPSRRALLELAEAYRPPADPIEEPPEPTPEEIEQDRRDASAFAYLF